MKIAVVDPSSYVMPYNHQLCNSLAELNNEVFLISSSHFPATWRAKRNYTNIQHFFNGINTNNKWFKRISKLNKYSFEMQELIPLFNDLNVNIVHFQWLFFPFLDRILVKRLKQAIKRHMVLTIHNYKPRGNGYLLDWTQHIAYCSALKLFDEIIVHTEFTKMKIKEHNPCLTTKINVIPHGVLDYYHKISKECSPYNKKKGKLNILFFGGIRQNKGLDILIKAISYLPFALLEKLNLAIYGKADIDIKPLVDLVNNNKLNDFIEWHLGFIPEEDIGCIFESSDVLVLPYREIDQSGVLLLGIGYSIPIVASNIGGLKEVIKDQVHGLLVPPNNPKELALALKELLNNDAKLGKMKEALKELSKDLSWDKIGKETFELYKGILE